MTILKASCPYAEQDLVINPLFAEFDVNTARVRWVCLCGELHERQLPYADRRRWARELRRIGCWTVGR